MLHARSDYDHIQDNTGKIAEDEPVFLFRAQDLLAPDQLDRYAVDLEGVGNWSQATAVRNHAQRMRDWQAANPSRVKYPDAPSEVLRV